jgi:DedD protein
MVETDQDTEITLGTGKMLGLFFALVIVCGVFFAVGFSLGRRSTPAVPGPTISEAASPPAVTKALVVKNSSPSSSNDFGFYKAVEQKTADTQLSQPESSPGAQAAQSQTQAPPDLSKAAEPANGAAYQVQVAAVSRQEDAEALVEALKKKDYSAFLAASSSNDKLFHVQIGPFADLKDAENMRKRLVADGYNPIVKK